MKGLRSNIYIDSKKIPIKAGMPFKSNDYKIRTIGYKIVRFYFDSEEKDCLIGEEEINRVIKN